MNNKQTVVFNSRIPKKYTNEMVEVPIDLDEETFKSLIKAFEYAKRNGKTESKNLEDFASKLVIDYVKNMRDEDAQI